MAFEKGSNSRVVGIAVVAGLVAGYAISGYYIYHAVIGLDASAFPAGEWIQQTFGPKMPNAIGGLVLGLGSLLLIPVIAFVFALLSLRRPRGVANGSRRRFLASSATGLGALLAGAIGAAANALFGIGKQGGGWYEINTRINSDEGVVKTNPVWEDEWRSTRVESYGRLGRTEWPVSDTVLGAGRLKGDEAWKIVKAALERGVNYVDTAPDYSAAGSELVVGRALQEFPREKVFLATKFCYRMWVV